MKIRLCPFNALSIWTQAKLVEKAMKLQGHEVEFVKYISMEDAVRKTADAYAWFVVANPSWVTHIAPVQHALKKRVGSRAVCYTTIEGIPYPHMALTSGARWIEYTANSFFTKECLEKAGLKVVRVIHHAIDLEEVRLTAEPAKAYRKQLAKDFKGKTTFLYVGRDDHRKNIMGLVEAVDILAKDHKDEFVVFLITDRRNLQQYDRENIMFVGTTGSESHETLMRWMGAVDFFAFPSVSEGFGVPLLEALAMGTPAVCVEMPPLTEFTNPSIAMYVRYYDVEYMKTTSEQFFMMHRYHPSDFADAMLKAMELKTGDPQKYREMRAQAAEHAVGWDLTKVYSDFFK